MYFNYSTIQERIEIGNIHREEFKELYVNNNMIESEESVKIFKVIKGIDLLSFHQFPSYQEIEDKLIDFDKITTKCCFVSHRWLSFEHPDPDGSKMKLLSNTIEDNFYYWIDYSCLPQYPRSKNQKILFERSLKMLPSLMFEVNFIIIRLKDDDYFNRAWCFFEILSSYIFRGKVIYLTNLNNIEKLDEAKIKLLQKSLIKGVVSKQLKTTIKSDLLVINSAVKTLSIFSLLNIISHYMVFANTISAKLNRFDGYFWGEDRYYFIGTCDFTKMIEWVYDKILELNIDFKEFSTDESIKTENIFLKMANVYHFKHKCNIFDFAEELVFEEKKLKWLIENNDNEDSSINLFYILTS